MRISRSDPLIEIATKLYQLIDIGTGYITVHYPSLGRRLHTIVCEVLLQGFKSFCVKVQEHHVSDWH